jgi:PKD repeat protein
LFVDADGIDDMFGTEDDNLYLLPGSPCIDTGDNSVIPESVLTDLDGNPRIVNNTVDMGAFETYAAPISNFAATPRSGNSPLVVQFTDTSIGHVLSHLWDFGDGTASTEQNPIHMYTLKDTSDFTVSLSVTGLGGTDTETKTNYIHLNPPPMHVNISLWKKDVFRSWYQAYAELTVTQNDSTGLPIAGVTIEGTWSGGYGGTVPFSSVTDANGKVNLGTEWTVEGSTVTFTVNKVIIGGKEYDIVGTTSASIRI